MRASPWPSATRCAAWLWRGRLLIASYLALLLLPALTLYGPGPSGSADADDAVPRDTPYAPGEPVSRLPVLRFLTDGSEPPGPAAPADPRSPLCSSLDELVTGRWGLESGWAPVYHPTACRLARVSGAAARRCLRNKHVALVGDSITRYQYLNLAHFLVTLRYPRRYGEPGGGPSLARHDSWPSWPEFFEGTARRLSDTAGRGWAEETCDCVRSYGDRRTAWGARETNAESREMRSLRVRFLARRAGRETETLAELRLSYKLAGIWPATENADPGVSAAVDAVRYVLITQQPDVLVLNVGVFANAPLRPVLESARKAIVVVNGGRSMARWTHPYAPRLIWKASTRREAYNVSRELAAEFGYEYFDVGAVVESARRGGIPGALRYDDQHFEAGMNEVFNDLLLHHLCHHPLPAKPWEVSPPPLLAPPNPPPKPPSPPPTPSPHGFGGARHAPTAHGALATSPTSHAFIFLYGVFHAAASHLPLMMWPMRSAWAQLLLRESQERP